MLNREVRHICLILIKSGKNDLAGFTHINDEVVGYRISCFCVFCGNDSLTLMPFLFHGYYLPVNSLVDMSVIQVNPLRFSKKVPDP